MKEIRMPYSQYMRDYPIYQKVRDSYDAESKTVAVLLPDYLEYIPPKKSKKWMEVTVSRHNVYRKNNYVIIDLPYCSEYQGYTIVVSSKLIHDIDYAFSFKFSSTFTFSAENEDVKKEISALEMAEIFDCTLQKQMYPEVHIPEHLEPVEIEALEELIDAD